MQIGSAFLLRLENLTTLDFEWVKENFEFGTVAISLFFASLPNVTPHARFLVRGPRNFSRLELVPVVCFERVTGTSNISFAIRFWTLEA
jgi:hypothetical protein